MLLATITLGPSTDRGHGRGVLFYDYEVNLGEFGEFRRRHHSYSSVM